MPTLAGFNGADLVPDVLGAIRAGGANALQGRAVMRDMQADQLALDAAGGNQDALLRLSRIDPQAATVVGSILKDKNTAEAERILKLKDDYAKQAYSFLQIPKDRGDLRMNYLARLAEERSSRGESIDDLVRLSGLSADEQDIEANRILTMAASLDDLLKPMFGGEEYGLNLTQAVDESGNPVFLQSSSSGKPRVVEGYSPVGKPQVVDYGGVKVNYNPVTNQLTDLTGAPLDSETLQKIVAEEARRSIQKAGAVAEAEAAGSTAGRVGTERAIEAPMAQADAMAAIEELQAAQKMVRGLVPRANWKTTGPLGALMSKIPGTEAFDYRASLQTVKSRMGLDTLVALKKQGGTLGAVSEKELDLLLANIANLEQAQNDDQFVGGLETAIKQYDRLINRVNAELAAKYKKPQAPATSTAPAKSAPDSAIQHLRSNPTPGMKAAFKAKYGYLPEGM